MLIAQNIQPPRIQPQRIQQPRISQPYISPAKVEQPRVYKPFIAAPIQGEFIVSLPIEIAPNKEAGCFTIFATNTTDSPVTLYKIISTNKQGKQIVTTGGNGILPGKIGKYTQCNVNSITSVQFKSQKVY
jgi:hypothetical protein